MNGDAGRVESLPEHVSSPGACADFVSYVKPMLPSVLGSPDAATGGSEMPLVVPFPGEDPFALLDAPETAASLRPLRLPFGLIAPGGTDAAPVSYCDDPAGAASVAPGAGSPTRTIGVECSCATPTGTSDETVGTSAGG